MKRLAVYCGSRFGTDLRFRQAAHHLGHTLATRGIGVVYGGGRLGLMGTVADAALAVGGEVIGVIPEALREAEAAHLGCTTLHVVPGMHERKALMTDLADGFVTLPGGVGTMDELFEALSWQILGYHAKPVGLLNVAGFYDPLIALMDAMATSEFLRPQHRANLIASDDIDDLLAKLAACEVAPTVIEMVREQL